MTLEEVFEKTGLAKNSYDDAEEIRVVDEGSAVSSVSQPD